jgi:hypothetical protein
LVNRLLASITGTDSSTGYAWPPQGLASSQLFQLLADNPTGTMDPTTIGNYMFNQIVPVTGHKGTSTMTLYSQVTRSGCCGGDPQSGATQNNFELQPTSEPADTYISYWFKYQPDLDTQLAAGLWRSLFVWKTGTAPGSNDGDYRVVVEVATWSCPGSPTPPYCWLIQADNSAGGNPVLVVYWTQTNSVVPVPIGEWFKFEVFWHRSTGADGRIWVAINGQVICDKSGPNEIANPMNRVYVTTNYGSGAYPQYQWLDDLQIWSGFPVASTGDPWYDPPYAPH